MRWGAFRGGVIAGGQGYQQPSALVQSLSGGGVKGCGHNAEMNIFWILVTFRSRRTENLQ